jgi:hypothetical protein
MANTYTLISSVNVGSGGAANIEFTSIPATYTDLVVKVSPRFSPSAINAALLLKFNSDASTSNYTGVQLRGSGSAFIGEVLSTYAGSYVAEVNANTTTASTFSNVEIYIPNYLSSNKKSMSISGVMENNATLAFATLNGQIWNSTSAITSITLNAHSTGNFMQYSTAYLYGISNA